MLDSIMTKQIVNLFHSFFLCFIRWHFNRFVSWIFRLRHNKCQFECVFCRFRARFVEFNARCLVVHVSLAQESISLWDRFNLRLLKLQCDMGVDIDGDTFLLLSYSIIGLSAYFLLKKIFWFRNWNCKIQISLLMTNCILYSLIESWDWHNII